MDIKELQKKAKKGKKKKVHKNGNVGTRMVALNLKQKDILLHKQS
jgi:hypothetical protein